MYKYVLASKSPRRKELLGNIGYEFQVMESDFDESQVSKELEPELYVKELAMFKAMSLVKNVPYDTIIIGADTVVVHEGKILGKPLGRGEAIDMLRSLSGSVHYVYTGVCAVRSNDAKCVAQCEVTAVHFRELDDSEIEYYVDNYSPYDKAGSYGIQEYAGVFVSRIEGDYFNIVGLPVSRLHNIIRTEY